MVIGPMGPGQLAASFARAFERLGKQVSRFDCDRAYYSALPGAQCRAVRRLLRGWLWQRMNAQTVAIIRRTRPDFVLVIKGTYLHAATVRLIRHTLGIPIGNYYPDNPYCGVPLDPRHTSAQRRDLVAILAEYTRVWIWQRDLARQLRQTGVAAAYLPFGVDPAFATSAPNPVCASCGPAHSVVFVGNHTDKREAHLRAVTRHTVGLWGNRWTRAASGTRHITHSRALVARQCAAAYAAAAVSLNVLSDLNMPGHNMRTFEIPGGGGVMLSSFTREQAEFFPEDDAAVYYRDPAEIDDKLDRLLGDHRWARRVRERAASIASAHTYVSRATALLADLAA